ncbi:MAG: SusC/RagA family TonB-linked outer membrane protein [Agriterribacter sp.]
MNKRLKNLIRASHAFIERRRTGHPTPTALQKMLLHSNKQLVALMLLIFTTTASLAGNDIRNTNSTTHSSNLQSIDIKGKVTNVSGDPVVGASVTIKGSSTGTTTDENGNFSLNVPDAKSVLVVSSVGYTTQEVVAGSGTDLSIQLVASGATDLADVVVIGYGTRKKSDLTGAVGTVRSDALSERPAASLNQNLSGRITGVNVSSNSGRPGGRANIRIRGATSISISNNPLYVIDGVILNSADLQNGSTPIDYINPNDIASIEVLKDASSTAIYGARGANGVILITTKRGSSGGGKLTYDGDFSIGVAPKKLAVLNAREFLETEEIAYANAQKYDPVGWASGTKYVDPRTKRTNPLLFDANGNPLYETDWQDETFRKAFTQNHQVGFTGGNDKGSYGAYLNHRNENGIIKGSWIKRYAARFVFDSQIKPWLKVGGNLGYTDQTDRQIDILGGGGITVMRQVLEALPFIPVKYPNGNWGRNRDYPGMEGGDSPLRIIDERTYLLRTQTMLGNMYANIKLMDGLELRTTLGTNIINQRRDNYNGIDLQYISSTGNAEVVSNRYNSWQWENYLTYNKSFGIHNINAMAGLAWQHVDRYEVAARSQTYIDNFYNVNNLGAGAVIQAPGSFANAYGINSYFGRVNYTLLNKYLFTITGRQDGSSKFGSNNRYAFFPSAALAWKVTEEKFMESLPVVSNLKLRTSYGETGNSEINAYQSDEIMGNYEVIFGGNREIGIGVSRMGNPGLRWEKVRQVDFGLELGLFNNRVNIEFDWYRKRASDMLLSAPVPRSSGYNEVSRNVGSMENKGVEIALNTINIQTANFTWSSLFNISINKNKVIALTGGSDIYSGATVIRVGEPVGSFFGRVHLGTWGSHEAAEAAVYNMKPGDVKYLDLNNDKVINDNDRTIIGKGIPDGFGTFMNTFQYKNWSLMVDLQFMYGNDVLDRSIHSAEDRQGIANSYKTVLNAWTEENQNTPIAQIRPINAYYTTNNDSHKVTDASFIRGRNLLLSYTFTPQTASALKLDRLRVFASVQNFFVSTKYSGYDPEVSNSGSPFDQGFGLYDYPRPRVFMLGVNVGL